MIAGKLFHRVSIQATLLLHRSSMFPTEPCFLSRRLPGRKAVSAKAERFSGMNGVNCGTAVEISQRSGETKGAVIAPRGQTVRLGRLLQETHALSVKGAELLK